MNIVKESQIIIPLEGMDSEHCAMIIDKALAKIEGITSHKVELNNNRALIEATDLQDALVHSVEIIRQLGYEVPTVKGIFPVLNMSCASCASSAQNILEIQPGIIKASVNYANTNAMVEYIPTVTNPQKLKSALQSIGYDLMVDESDEAKDQLQDIQQQRFKLLQKKTIAAIVLSIPVVIIGMFFMNTNYANYIMWLLSTPVLFIFGRQFFINAWKQIKHGSTNMDSLVAMSTGTAYLFSVFNTLNPDYWHSRGHHAHVYFEAATVVIAFILLGKWLEERAKGNSSFAIKKLMGLQPKTVTVIMETGLHVETKISNVSIGNTLLVKPGEKIAVDGIITKGSSFVDESMISGEPIPVEKKLDDVVFAGTINQKGSFEFIANKVGGDTVLSQIINMVQQAQGSKAPVQKLVDKIASIFVPIVIGIAIITLLAWLTFGGENGLTQGMLSMITVLVIACPCALGLATPTAIMVGVGKGAENGILIKDAESLELAKRINAVILDKTGTITEGKPDVAEIYWLNENKNDATILQSIEKQSEHPLAEAIVRYLNLEGSSEIRNFESITGLGVKAQINDNWFYVGNSAFLDKYKILIDPSLLTKNELWLEQAKTVIWFADASQALAIIAISDKIKASSVVAIKQLRSAGIEVYMLTGDSQNSAASIAKQTGITNFKSEMLPADKANFVKELQQKEKIVAMVGDGINDSQALAQADVSIAMGKGSDIAMDVAKMTLISSDLTKVMEAIHLSKITVAVIRQNLFWAFVYNIIGIPLAAGILYPINGFLLNPMIAGAAMALSSVSVVTNSLRLKNAKLK